MAIVYRLQKGSRLTVEEMDGNFQHVEDYLTGLTASVSNLASVVAGITASEALQDATVIAGLTASVNTLTTNLASATASIDTNMNDIAALQDNIGLLNDAVGIYSGLGLSASVASLSADVAGLTASVIDLQNALTGVTGDFNFLLLVGGVTQSGTFSFVDGILGTYSI